MHGHLALHNAVSAARMPDQRSFKFSKLPFDVDVTWPGNRRSNAKYCRNEGVRRKLSHGAARQHWRRVTPAILTLAAGPSSPTRLALRQRRRQRAVGNHVADLWWYTRGQTRRV